MLTDQRIVEGVAGYNSVEDVGAVLKNSQLKNDYWESKRVKIENTTVPMYLTGSYL